MNIFSVFGLPKEIVSDNGFPFSSGAFSKFCENHGIICTKSPPYHPQSNGQAERFVGTVKLALTKQCLDATSNDLSLNQKISKFLIFYRNTPSITTAKTPSELIFTYKPRILLDTLINCKGRKNIDPKLIEKNLNKNIDSKLIENNLYENISKKIKFTYFNFQKR